MRKKSAKSIESRREPLLSVAARLFTSKGYESTSIRDLANAVGMLPGSVYYHFQSKDDILVAVYAEGAKRLHAAFDAALEKAPDDPWQRLELTCTFHLSVLLDDKEPFARLVAPEPRGFPESLQHKLSHIRNEYVEKLVRIIADLPLNPNVDRWLFRAALFGSINWVPTWYKPNMYTPGEIIRGYIYLLKGEHRNALAHG